MERIRFAILKMTKESPLNLAVGIYLAQADWRDLLMSAGFGNNVNAHMIWYDSQLSTKEG
jgi:sulfopyruvate decarboxylase TPP-binding subunit